MWKRLLMWIDSKTTSKSGEIALILHLILKWLTEAEHEWYNYILLPFFLFLNLVHFISKLALHEVHDKEHQCYSARCK